MCLELELEGEGCCWIRWGLVVGGPFKVTGVMGQARLVIDTNTESALPQAVVNQRDRCDVVRQ